MGRVCSAAIRRSVRCRTHSFFGVVHARRVESAQNPSVDEHVLHILLGIAGVGAIFAGFSGLAFAPLVLTTWNFSVARTWGVVSLLLGLGSLVPARYACLGRLSVRRRTLVRLS
jgi:hypothetical protein